MDGVGAAGTIREIADHLLQNWDADHRYLGDFSFMFRQQVLLTEHLTSCSVQGLGCNIESGGWIPTHGPYR